MNNLKTINKEDGWKTEIIKSALHLNSLLEQELWRTEQKRLSYVDSNLIELTKITVQMNNLITKIPDIDAVIKNTMSK